MVYTEIEGNSTYTRNNLIPGAEYIVSVSGADFDSCTVTIKWSDGTNDVAFSDGALTAAGIVRFYAPTSTIKIVQTDEGNGDTIKFSVTPVTMRG